MNKLDFQNSSENQKVKNVDRSCERYNLDRSLEDILPSPAKFRLWNKSESALRPLCKAQGSLRNILNSCPTELAEGHYRWRQDRILKAIANIHCTALRTNQFNPGNREIQFLKSGTKPKKTVKPRANILSPSIDWEL